MQRKRFVFLSVTVWECLKLILVLAAVSALFHNMLVMNRGSVFWLVLLCSGYLMFPALSVVLFLKQSEFSHLLPVFKVGKIVTILPCFLLLILELSGRTMFTVRFIFLPFTFSSSLFLFIIFSIDLIFLSVILSLKEETRRS
jgi:hypothetical protein